MLTRFIRHFIKSACLFGVGGWAMSIGLPVTEALTPFWGWVLTVGGGIAFLSAILLSIRSAKLFRVESSEIELRQPSIIELRKVLGGVESQIDDVRSAVEDVPLSHYERNYLSKFEGYQEFKQKYIAENGATESDAQYVALGVHCGMNNNPLFSDSLKGSPAQVSLDRIRDLEQELPDPCLHTLVELLIDVKKR